MYKDKKIKQLGIDPATAASRLKKEILFHYIKKAGENYCHQCGVEIINSLELSIEHKIPWLDSDDPNKLFFDLDNIAFSHLSCNISAARKPMKGIVTSEHGTISRYSIGCRCDICKESMKLWKRTRRHKPG